MSTLDDTLTIPEDVSPRGRVAAEAILSVYNDVDGKPPYTGGCRAFFSPDEWRARGEKYGTEPGVVLIVVYDGGELSLAMDGFLQPRTADKLRALGLWWEIATNWYSYVYEEAS